MFRELEKESVCGQQRELERAREARTIVAAQKYHERSKIRRK